MRKNNIYKKNMCLSLLIYMVMVCERLKELPAIEIKKLTLTIFPEFIFDRALNTLIKTDDREYVVKRFVEFKKELDETEVKAENNKQC